MQSAKPIEAGCLAVVIECSSDFFGEIVQVVSINPLYAESPDEVGKWILDLPNVAADGLDAPTHGWSADSDQLLRIDDPGLQKQIESEKELENV